jgi:PAS domain S-box-containing protein
VNSHVPERYGLSTPARVLLLIAFYFLGGLLGKFAAFKDGDLALVWPPAGIAIAAILLFGYRFVPGVALGAMLFAMMNGKPFGFFTFATAVGNSVSAMVCAYLLRSTDRFRVSFERVRDVAAFVVLAALLGTTINALFNVASLYLSGQTELDFGAEFFQWWVPNALGALLVTPLLLTWSKFKFVKWSRRRWIEAILCWGGLIAGTLISFESWYVYGIARYPLAYLPYPFLVWVALRFGVRGATLATFLVSGASIHAMLENRGPFVMGTVREELFLIGTYIVEVAIANLFLAAAASERSAALEATVESQKRYRAVVEDQKEAICRFDRRGRLLFVNNAFARSRHGTCEQLIGTSFLPQISAEDMDIPLQRLLELTPENQVLSYDARITREDGSPGWEHCTTRAIFDASGEITEFQMVSSDITWRKDAEEALRASEERIRAILVDGILTLDGNRCIVSCNPAAERIFGYTSDQLLNLPFHRLVDGSDLERYQIYLADISSHSVLDIELQGRRRDGTTLPITISLSPLMVNRRPGYIAVVRDIRERKQTEEQLRHAQKLDTVGHLAGGVAHDFNNILSVVLGHAFLLKDKHNIAGPPLDSVKQIVRAAERGTKLVRQLLMFSRRGVMRTKPIDINEVVADLSKMLQRVLGETVELKMDHAPQPLVVRADEGMLEQILMNLAVNARDAMPSGGALTLSTGSRSFTAEELRERGDGRPGTYAFMSVTDTGCGIPADVMPRIFEPFFTTKDVGKGTGLGLSIVYGIVKQHKGWIDVQTEIGRGTMFCVYLPFMETKTSVTPEPSLAAASV